MISRVTRARAIAAMLSSGQSVFCRSRWSRCKQRANLCWPKRAYLRRIDGDLLAGSSMEWSVTISGGIPSRKRLLQLVRQMRGRRLAVIGDWMLDRYLWGTANRISPEAAVPVVEFEKQTDRLGGAGNVAANLAALGAKVEAFGIIGGDEAGESLRRQCQDRKFGVRGILQLKGRPTTLKTRVMARHQQIVRIDRETRMPLTENRQAELSNRILS